MAELATVDPRLVSVMALHVNLLDQAEHDDPGAAKDNRVDWHLELWVNWRKPAGHMTHCTIAGD